MGRLLLIISQILGSRRLVDNRALAGTSHLITSRALVVSRALPGSRILRSKHLLTSTTSVVTTLVDRVLPLVGSSRLTINPALVILAPSRIHRILLNNSHLLVRVSLFS